MLVGCVTMHLARASRPKLGQTTTGQQMKTNREKNQEYDAQERLNQLLTPVVNYNWQPLEAIVRKWLVSVPTN